MFFSKCEACDHLFSNFQLREDNALNIYAFERGLECIVKTTLKRPIFSESSIKAEQAIMRGLNFKSDSTIGLKRSDPS